MYEADCEPGGSKRLAEAFPTQVAALFEGVTKSMLLTKLSKRVVMALLVLSLCELGSNGLQALYAQATLPSSKDYKPAESTEKAPPPGTYFVVLRVTNCGTWVERKERQVTVRPLAVAVLQRKATDELDFGFPPRFVEMEKVEGTIEATHGSTIIGVRLPLTKTPAYENLQVVINKDRTAVELTAERVASKGSKPKENTDSSVKIPLTVIEEKTSESEEPTQTLRNGIEEPLPGWMSRTTYSLPPIPNTFVRAKQKIDVEIRLAGEGGQSTLHLSEKDVQLPWKGYAPHGRAGREFVVYQEDNHLRVWSGWLFP
jgi:hypothetical protein